MNRKLMAGLVAVLVATGYLQLQGEDDLLAKPEKGASARSPRGDAHADTGMESHPASRRTAPAQGGHAASADAALAPWVADALVHGVRAWQGRAQALDGLPAGGPTGHIGPMASAWSAAQPPAAPVIRPPAPAETVVVAAPAPVAPRFPHQWVGRFNDGVVLSGADATWVVRVGDVIEGQWRVERVEDHRMSLTYLPLNLPQQVVMR